MGGKGALRAISRVEFVPANFASLIIALAWAYNAGMDAMGLVLPIFLAFAVISLVSIAGAHFNTYSDAELDRNDPTKRNLVEALLDFGKGKLRRLMAIEVVASMLFMVALFWRVPNPGLLLAYGAAVFLAYAYSMLPFRFKGRSILAMSSLMLILSVIPITFTYVVLAPSIEPLFALFLAGHCMVIYGLIIPTEIRDHEWDKSMGITTMTVRLGLGRATLLGISLLGAGLALMGSAFVVEASLLAKGWLGVFLAAPALAIAYVTKQYAMIRSLLRGDEGSAAVDRIVSVASRNPRWITLVSQSIVLVSLALIVAKIIA